MFTTQVYLEALYTM